MSSTPSSLGGEIAQQLFDAISTAQHAPLAGARDLPVLHGVNQQGYCTEPQENVLVAAGNILVESARTYRYGNTIVLEAGRLDGEGAYLVTLRADDAVEPGAESWLANLFVCQVGEIQLRPPPVFTRVLLTAEPVVARLPRIEIYAARPVFDEQFVLRQPGWHRDVGILVHSPEIEPVVYEPPEGAAAIDRLPPHLRTVLRGFCFKSAADLANFLALLITGLLLTHFIDSTKALGLVDGNQRDLGKSWLVRVMGLILDGTDPPLVHFTEDQEELQKRIGAHLLEGCGSVLLIDNAKVQGGGEVSSPVIEANSMAPEIALRVLGQSHNIKRPNDLLWTLTMNDTRASPDMVSRAVPVRLHYEGRTEDRVFQGPDPIAYAREHRLELLGELAGMVMRWTQAGRPDGSRTHRCRHWARIVGGIVETAGLPEFLDNLQDAAAEFNTQLDELAALAEAVIAENGPVMFTDDPPDDEEH